AREGLYPGGSSWRRSCVFGLVEATRAHAFTKIMVADATAGRGARLRPPDGLRSAGNRAVQGLASRKDAMCSLRKRASSGDAPAPAGWPQSEGIGASVQWGMNAAS